MRYNILSLSDKHEWKDCINRLPIDHQDVYYTPEYYSLYENNGDGKSHCFVFEKDGELALYPFLLNSINELGYELDKEYFDIQGAYGYNGVVSSTYNSTFINDFYVAFRKYCDENNIVAEFTRFHPLNQNLNFSKNHIKVFFDRNTIFIDTTKSIDDLWLDLQRSTKKQINRCYNRHQVVVKILKNEVYDLDVFIKIYWESLNRIGSNQYLYFNKNYFEQLLSLKSTIQFIAYYEGQPISTLTAMMGKNILHGHLGGTINDYVQISPFSLLYWEMIKFAKDNNLKYLHVGGGATSDKEDKLLLYKQHFSNLQADFHIGRKVHNEYIYKKIIEQWKEKRLDSYNLHSNKILGYREI